MKVLKYLVLSYMLMGSDINPFDSQETKPYVLYPFFVCQGCPADSRRLRLRTGTRIRRRLSR